jgi:hypothetical protein
MGVAVLASLETRAGSATELGPGVDSSGAGLNTTTAVFVAGTPGTPPAYVAVDRASLGVASCGCTEERTHNATIGDVRDDGPRLGHGACATGHGASTESRPARNLAINRTRLAVADALHGKRTVDATVRRFGLGVEFSHLGTTDATRLAASTPCKPRVLTVNGARVNVAISFITEVRA